MRRFPWWIRGGRDSIRHESRPRHGCDLHGDGERGNGVLALGGRGSHIEIHQSFDVDRSGRAAVHRIAHASRMGLRFHEQTHHEQHVGIECGAGVRGRDAFEHRTRRRQGLHGRRKRCTRLVRPRERSGWKQLDDYGFGRVLFLRDEERARGTVPEERARGTVPEETGRGSVPIAKWDFTSDRSAT